MSEEVASAAPTPSDVAPILVAVDFTADSEAALIWACGYAEAMGAPVMVLHVVHDPGDAPGYYNRRDEDLLRPMEEVAAEMMAEFLAKARKQHPGLGALAAAESHLVKGIPPTRIL
ncbi:MAG: universal stress protein, partial [Methyloligellaceae bacterium]